MPGFHIEHAILKYLINHKRGGRAPLGPPLNPLLDGFNWSLVSSVAHTDRNHTIHNTDTPISKDDTELHPFKFNIFSGRMIVQGAY